MNRTFMYSVRTRSGITFHIEASNQNQAEQRARDPAIARTLSRMILEAVSSIESVTPHRGPPRLLSGKLTFHDEVFRH